MSKTSKKGSRRKREAAPMPLSGAGLVRFFEEEVEGVKIQPEMVLIGALSLIISVLLAHVFLGAP